MLTNKISTSFVRNMNQQPISEAKHYCLTRPKVIFPSFIKLKLKKLSSNKKKSNQIKMIAYHKKPKCKSSSQYN